MITERDRIRDLSADIYHHWFMGNKQHAKTLIGQVPQKQVPYVIMVCTRLSVIDKCEHNWAKFIMGMTE